MYVCIVMLAYEIFWVWIFGSAWYSDDITTPAWQSRSTIRGICFNLYFINIAIKCLICYYTYKIGGDDQKTIETKHLLREEKEDY